MSQKSLEDVINAAGSPVQLLRNSQTGPYIYPVVPPEFSNWRDEQRAWRDTCILFNQSYHMTDMYMEGPDALKVLSMLGVNSFNNFGPSKAKQFVACNYDGYVIGDVILFHLEPNRFNLVGRPSVHNWVQYHCETGGYNVKLERDERTVARPGPIVRKAYRYQVQGPNALKVIEKVTGKTVPDVKFFNMTDFQIAGRRVRALRHGMVGQPGFELFGPWEDGDAVKAAIVEAGQEFGLRQSGARTYSSNTLESGWIPSPLPAIYTGEKMKAYRQWLPSNTYEAIASLGGSFYSNNIQDYYLTPWDLGYGPSVKFDHDFIGREALEKIAAKPRRKKVTFAWHGDDMAKIYASLFRPDGENYKFYDLPNSNYASSSYDKVMRKGQVVGFSMFGGYSYNERTALSLGVVDPDVKVGEELTVVWGEENGGSGKTTVERHKQLEVRVRVSPVPYAREVREAYHEGWRTRQE